MERYIDDFETSHFAFDSCNNILEEKDIGICADIASILTPESSVSALKCFQGCPYTNTAFVFDVKIGGETVKSVGWRWLPNAIKRWGETKKFRVETLSAVVPRSRSVVHKITVSGKLPGKISLPIAVMYRGKTRKEELWKFSIPKPEKLERVSYEDRGNILSYCENNAGYHLTSSLEGMRLFDRAYLWENDIEISPEKPVTFYLSAHMGDAEQSLTEAKETLFHYEEKIESSFEYLRTESKRIYENLPRLKSDSEELDRLYYRSLVTYILCRWENPELCSMPYYSTGSVNGACMCSYLWDYCGGLMLHPIYDPKGNKVQLKAYLKNDLTSSYALNPVTAGAVGPWYQINQEKIICMVYYHVLATMDKDFLHEKVGDKMVIDWMRYHAYVCDDTSKDVELYDYGEGGNDHLEIHNWGNGPYNGIMPDLNARRYMNYMRVYELTKIAGCTDENLRLRANVLRDKLKSLWNEKEKWYDFIDAEGNRDIRYTVQMFKFLNSGVIGKEERDGLVSHLNEREFLSEFGLHSLSKLDPQYDQDDIDNGGGGICTHFTMQICAQLYEMGYDEVATDILRRVYWWGERMPYLGDSCAANMMINRENTPLQGDISSVSCAQMIFFFIFGIKAEFDGRIRISPASVRPSKNMRIDNARLCGKCFSVDIKGDAFEVVCGETHYLSKIGETIEI